MFECCYPAASSTSSTIRDSVALEAQQIHLTDPRRGEKVEPILRERRESTFRSGRQKAKRSSDGRNTLASF